MSLSAPKQVVFLVSLVLAIVAIVAYAFLDVGVVTRYSFWLLTGGYAVLAAGVAVKGL